MTTFPGKPPHQDAPDSSWGSADEEEAKRTAAGTSGDDETPPVYGVGVPYGGNDRTEEVEPIALDMPFSPEERVPVLSNSPLIAPRRTQTPTPRTPLKLDAPQQLALSDLFDSTPPPSSLVPPDPAAFSTPPPGSKARRGKEARSPEPQPSDAPSPWSVSRQGADAQYFANTPAAPAARAPSSPAPASTAPVSTAPASIARGADPVASGGVVALPSINVLAAPPRPEPLSRSESLVRPESHRPSEPPPAHRAEVPDDLEATLLRPDSRRRVSEPPALSRADLLDDLEATLPRPIAPRAPSRVGLLEDLMETAPRPVAGRAAPSAPAVASEPPPAPDSSDLAVTPVPAAASPAETSASTSVYSDEPDPTSKVFLEELPEQLLSDEDAVPLPSDPPPAAAASPSAPNTAAVERSSPHASPAPPRVALGAARLLVDPSGAASSEAASSEAASFAAAASGVFEEAESEPTTQRRPDSDPPPRRSVPTLESVGNAAAARALSAEIDRIDKRADELARFPSDVPTSRPPDVSFGAPPESAPSERASRAGLQRRSRPPVERRPDPPPQSVLAMLPSTKTQQISLPSVMLGDDVEAEQDNAAQRRALRAGRQTVRIELPADFGRPGSAMFPGLTPGTSTALPLPEAELTVRGRPLKRYAPWALAAVLLLAALMLLLMRPRSGSLVVTALGVGHRAVESVQIFVDDKPLCDSSPCRISGLAAGTHKLRATAPGLTSEEQLVEIASGEEAATNIELGSAGADRQGGGVRVAAGEHELTLYVDDRRVGKLPQTVSGLAAGKHWIKLDREDGSPPIEKSVSVQAGELLDVDPRAARREKVMVTIQLSPDSEGASVTFDDAFLLDFPAELELEPRSSHTLTATKPGYEDFTLRLDLAEETQKQIEVALTPLEGASARPRGRAKPTGSSAAQAAARKAAAAVSKPASPVADSTQGLLNISSVPPSQIILNGRPLGTTPKTAVVVPGDSLQTIVFVHPKMGRRRAQKFVPAGKERTVSIRF